MKKLMIFVLAAAMAFGFAGTALAADSVELGGGTSGVSTVYWGPVFCTAPGGVSAFLSTGPVFSDGDKDFETGTTLYAISHWLTNALGTEMRAVALKYDSGATPIGGPALVSGTSDTVILYVQGPYNGRVGSGTHSGGTIYSIDGGTGTVYWTRAVPVSGFVPVTTPGTGGVYDLANSAASPFCLAPLTIDDESYTATRGGATIFGVSGATVSGAVATTVQGPNSGVSIWALNANSGAYATTSAGNSNVTAFAINESYSGVSVIHAGPVISGNSLFVLGWSQTYSAVTLFQFVKNDLLAGVSAMALVNGSAAADASDQWIPTPCVAGNSIFVVDNNGAVSAFYTANLNLQYSADYAGNSPNGGVTASPVTDGTYIVLCGTSSVSCFDLDNLSRAATSSSVQWAYNFGANKSIWATPAISNGYVWITVNDTVLDTSTTYRFTLSSADGDIAQVDTYGDLTYASTIVVDNSVYTISYDPIVKKNVAAGADAYDYWTQFKFGKTKTGANTQDEADEVAPGSNGGCFISTIK